MKPLSSEKSSRLPELAALTGIRFLAAAYVVVYHFALPFFSSSSAWYALVSAGYTAVGFFFLLSGFVLSYSYAGRVESTSARSFWVARWSRIYPAYLLAFLLAAPLQITGSLHVNGMAAALKKLLVGGVLHLALLQSWTPWTAWYWNIPAWSLSAEAFFYFCFPFVLPFIVRLSRKSAWRCLIVLFALELAVPSIYSAFGHWSAQPPLSLAQLAIEVNPLLRLPEFLFGMVLGHLFASGWRMNRRAAAWAGPLAILAACALLISFHWPRPMLASGLLLPVSALLIVSLAQQAGPLAQFLATRPLHIGGEASYGIYILQMPVAGLLGVLPGVAMPGNGQWWRLVVFGFVLLATAIASHYWIETPLRRTLLSRQKRKVAARASFATPIEVTP